MSIARALTRRVVRHNTEEVNSAEPAVARALTPARAYSTRVGAKPINRHEISLPVELLSTTNVLAYDAPDIYPQAGGSSKTTLPLQTTNLSLNNGPGSTGTPLTQPSPAFSAPSSASSTRSFSGSEASATSSATALSTPDLSREPSPALCDSGSPATSFFLHKTELQHQQQQQQTIPEEAEPADFMPTPPSPARRSTTSHASKASGGSSDAPAIPTRALSHTKKTSLARKRSATRLDTAATTSVSALQTPALTTSTSSFSSPSSPTSTSFFRDHDSPLPPMPLPVQKLPEQPMFTASPVAMTPGFASTAFGNAAAAAAAASTTKDLQQHQRPGADSHPFEAELAQVKELAEQFGVTDEVRIWDEEERFLASNGLVKWTVDDYLAEVQPLYQSHFYRDAAALSAEFF